MESHTNEFNILEETHIVQADLLPPQFANTGKTCPESILNIIRDTEDRYVERYRDSDIEQKVYDVNLEFKLIQVSDSAKHIMALIKNGDLYYMDSNDIKFDVPFVQVPPDTVSISLSRDDTKMVIGTTTGKLMIFDIKNRIFKESLKIDDESITQVKHFTLGIDLIHSITSKEILIVVTNKGFRVYNPFNLELDKDCLLKLNSELQTPGIALMKCSFKGNWVAISIGKTRILLFDHFLTNKAIEITIPDGSLVNFRFMAEIRLVVLTKKNIYIVDDLHVLKNANFDAPREVQEIGRAYERKDCSDDFLTDSDRIAYIGADGIIYESNSLAPESLNNKYHGIWARRCWNVKSHQLYKVPREKTYINIYENKFSILTYEKFQNIKLKAHDHPLTTFCVSYDGKLSATCERDYSINVYDQSFKLVHKFEHCHNSLIDEVVFTTDNKFLISGSADGDIKVWDINEKNLHHEFRAAHRSAILGLAVSIDNRFFYSCSYATIKIWSRQLMAIDHTFEKAHERNVYAIKASSSNKYLISVADDKNIKVWNLKKRFQEYVFINAHDGPITCLSLSNDDKLLLTGSRDLSLKLWNFDNKMLIKHFKHAHPKDILGCDIGNNGRFLMSYSTNKSFKLWRLDNKEEFYQSKIESLNIVKGRLTLDGKSVLIGTGQELKKIDFYHQKQPIFLTARQSHTHSASGLAFSSDGKKLITVGYDAKVITWNALTHAFESQIENAHSAAIDGVLLLNDDDHILTYGRDKKIKLWSLSEKLCIHEFTDYEALTSVPLHSVSLSNDNKILAYIGHESSVNIIDFEKREILHKFEKLHENGVSAILLSHDGKDLYTADDSIRVWSIETKEMISEVKIPQKTKFSGMRLSKDKKFLVASSEKKLIVWDWESKQIIKRFEAFNSIVKDMRMTSDSEFLLACSDDNTVKLWNLYELELIHSFVSSENKLNCLALSSDDKIVATCSDAISMWNFQSRAKLKTILVFRSAMGCALSSDDRYLIHTSKGHLFIYDVKEKRNIYTFENAHNSLIRSVDISKDNRLCISASEGKSIRIWDIKERTMYHEFKRAHEASINTASISADGKFIVSGSDDFCIGLFDVEAKKNIHYFKRAHSMAIPKVLISSDNKFIVSGSIDLSIKIWDVESKSLLHDFKRAHSSGILSLDLTRDDKYIISSAEDKCIKIWLVETRELMFNIKDAHKNSIKRIAVSRDGRFIASGSDDFNIKIWNLQTNKFLYQFQHVHTDQIRSLSWSSDNRYIYSSSYDCQIKAHEFMHPDSIHFTNLESSDLLQRSTNLLTNDVVFTPHCWNALHYYAIYHPTELANFPKNFKYANILDYYEKTPLHYLIAHQNPKYLEICNEMFDFILDFLEQNFRANETVYRDTLASLVPLTHYIYKFFNPTLIKRMLTLSYSKVHFFYDQSLSAYGDVISTEPLQLSHPIFLNSSDLKKVYSENGLNKVKYNATFLPFDFNLRADSTFKFLENLSNERRRFFFEDEYIISVLNVLWRETKRIQMYNLYIFSFLMIALTAKVSTDSDYSILLNIAIIIVTTLLLAYEVIQAYLTGLRDYFDDIWNSVDIMYLLGLVFTITMEVIDFDLNEDVHAWTLIAALFFGYLRWISYLRIFDATRNLIRTILVIFEDMKSFMLILTFTIIGFCSFLMVMRFEDQNFVQNLYVSYFLLFSPLEGEMSLSLQILSMIFPFLLNVVFLNMLINIMGDSFAKVQERRVYTDNVEKIELIQEASSILRFIFGPSKPNPKYLVFCSYDDDEIEGDAIKSEMIKISNNFELMNEEVSGTRVEVKEIERKVETMSQRSEAQDQRLASLELKLDSKVHALEKKLEENEAKIQTKLDSLEKSIQNMMEKLSKQLEDGFKK